MIPATPYGTTPDRIRSLITADVYDFECIDTDWAVWKWADARIARVIRLLGHYRVGTTLLDEIETERGFYRLEDGLLRLARVDGLGEGLRELRV